MNREEIKEMIKTASAGGKIQCHSAYRVAEEAKVPVEMVGRLINEMGLKITHCQLGCF